MFPFCGLWQPRAGAGEPSRADFEFFEKSVRPLLVEKCWPCHGDAARPKGGLRLTSRPSLLKGGDSGAAAIAGDPRRSPLIEAVRYEHEPKMPPKGKLQDREIEVLTRWVALGLPWPETKAGDREPPRWNTAAPPHRCAAAVLGVPAGQARGRAGRPRRRPGPGPPSTASCWRPSRSKGLRPADAGRQAHPDPTGDVRPDRPAADARGGRRLPRRSVARGVCTSRRPPAGLAAVRRALGPALARRRPLRRRPRPDPVARGERFPRGLALPGLGRRGLQSRSVVPGVRPPPGRRRPAAAAAGPAGSTRTGSSPRACWPSPTSCPATWTRSR